MAAHCRHMVCLYPEQAKFEVSVRHAISLSQAGLCRSQAFRERILECEDDPAQMHHLLSNLPPLGALSGDELARRAAAISQQCPPKQLLRNRHMRPVM